MTLSGLLGERYQEGSSLVHRLDPRAKLVLAVAYILSATLTPPGRWAALALLALLLAGSLAASRLNLVFVLKRSALALPFVMVALPLLFTRAGEELFTLSVLGWGLTASREGAVALGSILIKSWLSVVAALVLACTTPFPDLVFAMRWLRLPAILVSTVSFLYRYMFVIAEEAGRLLRAREARSASLGKGSGGTLGWRARVLGGMVGSLFLRSYERSERIYVAMQARGFQGEIRTLKAPTLQWNTILLSVLALLTLVAVQLYARF